MHATDLSALIDDARSGRISRRDVFTRGLSLGLSTAAILALTRVVPAQAAPAGSGKLDLPGLDQTGAGEFVFVRNDTIPDLDPYWYYNEGAGGIQLATYEQLIQYRGSSTDEFEPALAESWEVSADQSTFTFRLYSGTTFHSGDPLTAQTVKDAYTRVIKIDRSISNVITRFVPAPELIEVVDDLTIRFNLGKPQPLFLSALAAAFGPFVVNPRYVEEHKTAEDPWAHDWYSQNIDGTGPYRLVEFSPNEQIVLERFEGYHRGWTGSEFERVVLRFVPEVSVRRQLIENGDIDATTRNLTPDDLESLKSNSGLEVVTYDSTLASWVALNAVRLPIEARTGLSYAFPYDEVVNGAYKGLLKRSGPIPTTIRGYDPDVFLYQTDLARAKDLIGAGGFPEGTTFEYVLEAGDPVEETVAQLFQANLQEIGYDLDIQILDPSTVSSIVYGESDGETIAHLFGGRGWWPDYNDPYNQLYPSFAKASIGGGNVSHWTNDRFEEILAEAASYSDEARLAEIIKEAQNILTEQDPPAIYYGQQLWYTVLRKEIEGFGWNPLYLSSYHPLRALTRVSR